MILAPFHSKPEQVPHPRHLWCSKGLRRKYSQACGTHPAPATVPPVGVLQFSLSLPPPGRMLCPHTLPCLHIGPLSCHRYDPTSTSKARFLWSFPWLAQEMRLLIPLGAPGIFLPWFQISQIVFELSVHTAFSCTGTLTVWGQWLVFCHRALGTGYCCLQGVLPSRFRQSEWVQGIMTEWVTTTVEKIPKHFAIILASIFSTIHSFTLHINPMRGIFIPILGMPAKFRRTQRG